jgi:hypothetical protein
MPQTNYLTAAGVHQYDVTPDGSRFVMDSVDTEDSLVPLGCGAESAEGLKEIVASTQPLLRRRARNNSLLKHEGWIEGPATAKLRVSRARCCLQ